MTVFTNNNNTQSITISTTTALLLIVTTGLLFFVSGIVIVLVWQQHSSTPWSANNFWNGKSSNSSTSPPPHNNNSFWQERTQDASSSSIPFILALGNEKQQDPWKDLHRAMQEYNRFMSSILLELSKSLEVAQISEYELFDSSQNNQNDTPKFLLSSKIQYRIDKLSSILEQDEQTLQQLLRPFPELYGLTNQPHNYQDDEDEDGMYDNCGKEHTDHGGDDDDTHEQFSHLPPPRYSSSSSSKSSFGGTNEKKTEEGAPYDSSQQVIAHIVRDWTRLGQKLRQSTYQWCSTQLELYKSSSSLQSVTTTTSNNNKVLVPGAGLGRLAYDLSQRGYHVEANEYSIVMASAAYTVLSSSPTSQQASSQSKSKSITGKLHPFACDFFVNEVHSEKRYESVTFPDWPTDDRDRTSNTAPTTDPSSHDRGRDAGVPTPRGSLSYTIGDFTELYSAPYSKNQYDAIVTCFFIDTATNIYEYISIIHHLLKSGNDNDDSKGVWINVGPVQWHSNAKLHPSVDELRMMIESMGFTIKHWSVDKDPVPYRHDDGGDEHMKMQNTGRTLMGGQGLYADNVESTKYEAYRPLRFVAVRNKSTPGGSPANTMFRKHRSRTSSRNHQEEPFKNPYKSGNGGGSSSMRSNFDSQSEYQQTVFIEELNSDDDDDFEDDSEMHVVEEERNPNGI